MENLPELLEHQRRSEPNSSDHATPHIYNFISFLKGLSFLNLINGLLATFLWERRNKIYIHIYTAEHKTTTLRTFGAKEQS